MLLLDIHKPSLSSAGILPAYLPLAPCFYTSYSLLLAGVLKKIKFIYKMNTFIRKFVVVWLYFGAKLNKICTDHRIYNKANTYMVAFLISGVKVKYRDIIYYPLASQKV